FQAEDGIRDGHVTGVQTCALPIWSCRLLLRFECLCPTMQPAQQLAVSCRHRLPRAGLLRHGNNLPSLLSRFAVEPPGGIVDRREIGRASCRERVWGWVVEVALEDR